jgi:cyclopropane-fatty-acyl-phospholipid synthase
MNRWLDRLIARVIRHGRLEVIWPEGSLSRYGSEGKRFARIHFRDRSAEWAVLRNPELGLGEGYMDGRIDFPGGTLPDFLMLVNDNWKELSKVPFLTALSRARFLTRGLKQNNSMLRARRNVAHHYDLDERVYRLFLDSDMQYSCAYFESSEADLEEAQWAKKRHLASKLALELGQEVLDIGSGWGGLALFLGENCGVKVTGITLSPEQHRVSNERARERGLNGQVRFDLRDYRAMEGRFDRIVSVGMFEHVGAARYRQFFEAAARLLKPDGVMLLHSIGRFGPPAGTNPWIAKYIFPGGYIPALSEALDAVEHAGLYVTDIEILRLHYARTLKAWRERFLARWDEAAAIYDERFCRMWEFYLAGSEAAFRSGGMMVFQMQLSKDQATLPLTRDYMFAAEQALRDEHEQAESLRLAGE